MRVIGIFANHPFEIIVKPMTLGPIRFISPPFDLRLQPFACNHLQIDRTTTIEYAPRQVLRPALLGCPEPYFRIVFLRNHLAPLYGILCNRLLNFKSQSTVQSSKGKSP
jgi:hypothetical protein